MSPFLWFLLLILAALSYFSGGLNGAIIASKLIFKDDIRLHGSKNAGLTNFMRTYGKKSALWVILIDTLKTAVPIFICWVAFTHFVPLSPSFNAADRAITGRVFGAMFAILGHSYPPLYGFRGGKGVLAGGTAAIFIDWRVAIIVFGIFLLAVIFTRYVSLGSVLAGLLFPISFFIFDFHTIGLILSACCGFFIVFRHRGNITRLLKGEERKLSLKRKKEGVS